MPDILSPTGIEKPLGGEPHSRAQYLRNLDRINNAAIEEAKLAKGELWSAKVITNSGNIGGTAQVVYNLASFSFKAGRKYRIVWDTDWIGNSGTVAAGFRIGTCATTDGAAVITGITDLIQRNGQAPVQLVSDSIVVTAYYKPSVDTTVQIKFVGILESGTTFLVQGNRAGGANYIIYDDGAQY